MDNTLLQLISALQTAATNRSDAYTKYVGPLESDVQTARNNLISYLKTNYPGINAVKYDM